MNFKHSYFRVLLIENIVPILFYNGELMKELEQWLNELEEDIIYSINDDLIPRIKHELNEQSKTIYERYKPKMYRRRYEDGGFADIDNIECIVTGNINDGININARNVTKGNKDYLNGKNANKYIDEYIESGNGYDFEYAQPRPFYEDALDELDDCDEILINSLKSKGY